jgi:alpha-ketoglutarate-dependent 2,4-dichlorophenoxyacetate dioxygenase
MSKPEDRRLRIEVADISNLDKHNNLRDASDSVRLNALGNRLWHSDSSFKATPAKYSLLSGRQVVDQGGNTEFSDMRNAYDTLDAATKAQGLSVAQTTLYFLNKIRSAPTVVPHVDAPKPATEEPHE